MKINNIKKIICKVWVRKISGQKLVTVPKRSSIKKGDYVELKKV